MTEPEKRPPKRHIPKSTRKAVVASLLEEIKRQGGEPCPLLVPLTAEHLGVHRSTVYRWLDGKLPPPAAPRQLTTEQLIAIAANGSIFGAYEELAKRGEFKGSSSTFYRAAWATTPALLEGALKGVDGVRSSTVSVVQPRPEVLEVVSLDHLKNPFRIVGEGGHEQYVWLTILKEHGCNWEVPIPTFSKDGDGNAVTETVIAGIARFLSGVVASDGTVVGGIFGSLLVDNGLENHARAILAGLATLGITFNQTPFYTPHLNGRSERANGTYKRRFAFKQPGYDDKDAPKLRFGGKLANRGRLLTKIEFLERLIEHFRYENEERQRAVLDGRSSLRVWKDEAPPAVLVSREHCRHLFLAEGEKFPIVTNKGIEYDKNRFVDKALNHRFGQKVAIRVLPNCRDFVDVYDYKTGEFICEAINQKLLDVQNASEIGRVRTDLHKDIDYVQKEAARSLWLPGQDEDAKQPSSRRRTSTTPGVAPERPPRAAEQRAAEREFLEHLQSQKKESA